MPEIVTANQNSVVRRNPVLIIIGGIGSLLHVVLAMLLAFGVSLTTTQVASIEGAVGVLLSIILALVVNGQTTPYDPTVGNTPSNMALLRALEAEVNAGEQPTPPSGPVVEPPPDEVVEPDVPTEDPPEPEPEPVVAAPVKRTTKKTPAKRTPTKKAPAKKAAAKKAAPRRR